MKLLLNESFLEGQKYNQNIYNFRVKKKGLTLFLRREYESNMFIKTKSSYSWFSASK